MTSRKLESDSGTLKGREPLSDWLIRQAARKAPADLSERLAEEWRADMASRPSYLSRLRFALGCCWATQVIAFEHQPARMAATASSAGSALLGFSESHNASFYSRRGSSFAVVVALHVAVFYALLTWVTHPRAVQEAPPLIPHFLPKPDTPRDQPTTPKVDLTQITHRLPVPVIENPKIDPGDPGFTTEPLRPAQPPVSEVPAPPAHVVKRVMGGAGAGFPNVDEFYPSPEIRLSHQGAATVNVCVNPNGKLSSKPTLDGSSGYAGLDEAAVRLAQAGSGHYRATTEDGQPVSSCYQLRVRFQLKN